MIKIEALSNFLAKMSKREKTVMYVTVFVISMTLLDLLVIAPIFQKMASLDADIKEKEASIKRNMRILSQKDKIVSESAKYTAFLSEARPEEEEMTIILKEIEDLANKCSVYLIDMKPGGTKKAGSSKKYVINLTCEAQMEQLTEFMYEIESSEHLLMIEKYQISPKSSESSVAQCGMSISKISM
jgi:Tfp pilus assembly protein PilO